MPYYSFTGKIEISPTESYVVVSRYAIGYENKEPYVVLAKGEEKKSVKIEPYGSEYVKVLEGLTGGEVLIEQTKPKLRDRTETECRVAVVEIEVVVELLLQVDLVEECLVEQVQDKAGFYGKRS